MLKVYTTRQHLDRNIMSTDEYTLRHIYAIHSGMIDDEEFLRYVASNAREYYENYCDYGNRARHMIKLLGYV